MIDESKVVRLPDLPPPPDDSPIRVVQPKSSHEKCEHRQVEIDPEKRSVTCENPNCRAVLDAFDGLVAWSEWEQQAKTWYERANEKLTELIVHAPGTEAHTLCHSDSDRKEYIVRITNLIRDVTCLRCRKKLEAQGHANPFWDERVMREGSTRTARQLRDQLREDYHPACGGYHPKGRCPSTSGFSTSSEEPKPEAGGRR